MELKVNEQLVHYDVVHPNGTIDVVILHGWGHNGLMWKNLAELLPDTFKCYLIDLPGFGHSPLGTVRTLDDYSKLIYSCIDKLKLKKPVVLGHSFGAQLATYLVGNRPELASRLMLIAPAIKRERHVFGKLWFRFLGIMAKIKYILPRSWTYHLSSGLNYTQATPKLKLVFRNLIAVDVINLLRKINIPVLVVWGEFDEEVLGSPLEISQLNPTLRLKVIYDAGHNLHLEKPQDLARMIERYL